MIRKINEEEVLKVSGGFAMLDAAARQRPTRPRPSLPEDFGSAISFGDETSTTRTVTKSGNTTTFILSTSASSGSK
jgi:hypothetical protein